MYECKSCMFVSHNKNHYSKHLQTRKHIDIVQINERFITEEKEIHEEEEVDGTEAAFEDDFFPFANRLELLLYILRGSKYHNIDQELFKYILYILQVVIEDQIKQIPPFHRIWNMNIEGLELKPSQITIEDEDMYYIKPSDIINLQLSKVRIAKQIQRYPKESNFLSHQNTGIKWRRHMKSLMAKNSKEQRIYVGDRVRNGVNGESGRVDEFFLKDEDQSSDCQSIFASVQCDNEGKVMYDSYLKKEVIVTSQLGIGLMDNAMAAEFCHSMGAAAKENCRFCKYRGNFLSKGEPRTKEKTEEILQEVDQYPSHSTIHGIKRKKKADELNKAELWDPHRDLPPDLLHCRYLGDISILLSSMLSCSTDLQKENIQLAINSAEWNGFHHKCGSSFIRYHRSSQGKDFKAFVQLAPFVVKRAGYEQEVVQLWCMLAEIIHLINRRQLKESELAHLEDIQITFNQKVFDRFPETKRKQKMHHNLHTEDNIRMHGVPTEYTTEAGESWCGIVKNCQYITNHHNPNRDTAYKLTHVEEIGHIMDNGTWKVNGKRVSPARQTVEEICHSRIQSFVFGNQTENNDGHSSVKRSHDGLIKKSRGRTKNGEKLKKGDVIYYFNNDQVKFGEIMNISTTLIDISRMVKLDDEDRVFNCYKLRKSSDELSLAIDDVQGIVYVVHDCASCGCCVIMTRNDGKISRVFKHKLDHSVFLINRFKMNFDHKLC
ncbi:uncharacterized protein [Mytilus edulis]|uniref:uncharacterized protein isoform X2 n=1 Tax=Mytilus edulis TaxID=6550 RepID=UPI0039F0D510